jgi:hypothetical protein
MKLNPLQRWAIKIGIPRSILNGFAQEYYGYAIPDADGKYPDWWYREQGIPPTVRDCEVPKEVIKHEGDRNSRSTMAPKTYVRVRHGKVVEIVSNEAAIQSVPHFSSSPREFGAQYPQTSYTQQRREVLHTNGLGDFPVETDEIIYRVTQARRTDDIPRLSRATSTPAFSAPATDNDDIMSLIRDETIPRNRRPSMNARTMDPNTQYLNIQSSSAPFTYPQRSATVPNPRPNAIPSQHSTQSHLQTPTRGPSLPSSPRPTIHQRTETTGTENTIFGYYSSPAANTTTRAQNPYRPRDARRSHKPMEDVEEDEMSEWSGYATESEGAWEDEEEPIGRTEAFRQAAAERLRGYRREQ